MQIWKFTIKPSSIIEIEMPVGARIIHVQDQLGEAYMWAIVDPAAPLEKRSFRIVMTGEDFERTPGEYVGSFQIDGNTLYAFVGHVFEVGKTD